MKKVLVAVALVVATAGCGNGDGGGNGANGTPDAARPTGDGAVTTPGVRAAPQGRVNLPAEGTYRYEYTAESTNNTLPDATPQRADDDARLTSEVTVEGEVVTISDETTEGPAVATVNRRLAEDGVYDLSFETTSPRGTAGCTFDEPVQILPIPLEEREFEPQPFAGDGASCDGERKVTVEGAEDIQDAQGTTWSTWKVVMENTVRSNVGLSSTSTLTAWFSPDLGKEIKIESVAETIDPEGQVAARGESSQLLSRYPT